MTQTGPELGLGTWQMGGNIVVNGKRSGWRAMEDEQALDILRQFVQSGHRLLDTAMSYGYGHAERLIGKLFAQQLVSRQQVIVCTKYGFVKQGEQLVADYSNDALLQSVEDSLQRLQTDYIDYLLLHSPPKDFDLRQLDITVLESLKAQGVIREYGVSISYYRPLSELLEISEVGRVLEVSCNLFDRRYGQSLAQGKGDKILIARSPLANGFFHERYLQSAIEHHPDDFRAGVSEELLDWFQQQLQWYLRAFPQHAALEIAFKYIKSLSHFDFVITGMRKPSHLQLLQAYDALVAFGTQALALIDDNTPICYPAWAS